MALDGSIIFARALSASGLVLDVGAGGCPYPRSDILLERYISGVHRCGASVVADRPIVFADALRMPFRDKSFDFVVASHVLEHVTSPELFLNETMRVGRAGYIETPNVLFERLCPYDIHVLELANVGGRLMIHKKPMHGGDDFFARLRLHVDEPKLRRLFQARPQLFHVRYFWEGRIDYLVDNPEESCDWHTLNQQDEEEEILHTYPGLGWRSWGLRALRRYYVARRKNQVDWMSILVCPACKGTLTKETAAFCCLTCKLRYAMNPHPDFLRPSAL